MKTNPITDQIVGTLGNMRREVSTQGITNEADAMWQHALSLYKMRREGEIVSAGHEQREWDAIVAVHPEIDWDQAWVVGQCRECWGINRHEPGCQRGLPAFLRKQAD